MIISFINQKGGVGKSSLARAVSVEVARNNLTLHVADLDKAQQTFFKWAERRQAANIEPTIEVALYGSPKAALKAATNCDVLVIDGKAFADTHALEVAQASDVIVIPVGQSLDDIEPSVRLAVDLVNKGIDKASILFVVCRVTDNGEKEAMSTRNSIQAWGFEVAQGWVPFRTSYAQAMDQGKAFTEGKHKTLSDKADKIIQQIFDKAATALNSESK